MGETVNPAAVTRNGVSPLGTDRVERSSGLLILSKAAAGLLTALTAAANVTQPGASMTRTAKPEPPPPSRTKVSRVIVGRASWYGPGFHGRRTASGEVFNRNRSTIASRHLPFGTRVRVTYLRTGQSAEARVTDRGPYAHGRIIDCSEGLARKIGLRGAGVGKVKVEVLRKR